LFFGRNTCPYAEKRRKFTIIAWGNMGRLLIFLIYCTVFDGAACFAQQQTPFNKREYFAPGPFPSIKMPAQLPDKVDNKSTIRLLSADHYSSRLGFFCRQELQLDRITFIPIRFRLGSLETCNRQEGYLNFR
jgi:hypothetical protein